MSPLAVALFIVGGLVGLTVFGSLVGMWLGRMHRHYPLVGSDDE